MLSDDDDAAAAAVFAGLGQAELMAGNDVDGRGVVREGLRPRPDRRRQPVGMGYGAARAGHRPQQPGRPGRSGRAVSRVRCRGRRARKVARWPRSTCASHSATPVTTRPRSTPHSTRSRKGSSPASTAASVATSTRSPRKRSTRLGRWTEVAGVLARQPLADTLPVGLLRLARAKAMLAARPRRHRSRRSLNLRRRRHCPIDGWHQTVRLATAADVHLALGNWDEAAQAAEQGWAATGTTSVLWAARFAMFWVVAEVERTLDQRARREPVDVDATDRPACGSGSTLLDRSPTVYRAARNATLPRTSPTQPPA